MIEVNDVGEKFTKVSLLKAKVKTKYWNVANTEALSSVNMKVHGLCAQVGVLLLASLEFKQDLYLAQNQ
jgi:hypothetical protein